MDAVVAQGFEVGGHRATFLAPVEQSLIGTLALVPQVVDAVSVPVLASGGIMDGRGIAAARLLGAQGVQLGTAFLASHEAGTDVSYRRSLGRGTTITRVLTGRHVRAVRSELIDQLEASGAEHTGLSAACGSPLHWPARVASWRAANPRVTSSRRSTRKPPPRSTGSAGSAARRCSVNHATGRAAGRVGPPY